MKDRINQIISGRDWTRDLPLVLICLTVVSYGLLIPWMGFFWDDFPVAWIADRLDSGGLTRYFSDNRPLLSWLYRVSVPLLGTQTPWHWHVFAILTRFTATLSFYLMVRAVWPKYTRLGVWAGLFFLVYPGFKQQWVSIIYSHFFLILTGLLVSFYLSIRVLRQIIYLSELSPGGGFVKPRRNMLLLFTAWLLALQNLLFMDYFFFMELFRPILLWEVLREQFPDRRKRFQQAFRAWFPFLILWVGFVIWRFVTLQSQPHHNQITFFSQLQETPFLALLILAENILRSLWIAIPVAWGMVFQLPGSDFGVRTIWTAVVLIGFILAVLSIYLLLMRRSLPFEADSRKSALAFVWIGFLFCFVAGWSVWLPGLAIGTGFAADRFSLVFMPGAALILAGVIGLLPARRPFPWLLVALFTSLAIGQQFIAANNFRREWELLQRFFWQLSWRVPAMEAGTLILSDELPFTYYTDNSLTAPINWFYAAINTTPQMSYVLFYPARRLGTSLPGLEPGLAVDLNYLAATFEGNTSQVVGLVFEPPACLRLLEPDLDVENKMLPQVMQQTAALSSTASILTEVNQSKLFAAHFLGQEPAHNWCYYFEKADLARQKEDWEQVAALGDQAFATGDYPNDPMERLPFVEGYAHVSNWSRALDLSRDAQKITPKMQPVLCKLWERISRTTPASLEKDHTLQTTLNELQCIEK